MGRVGRLVFASGDGEANRVVALRVCRSHGLDHRGRIHRPRDWANTPIAHGFSRCSGTPASEICHSAFLGARQVVARRCFRNPAAFTTSHFLLEHSHNLKHDTCIIWVPCRPHRSNKIFTCCSGSNGRSIGSICIGGNRAPMGHLKSSTARAH